MAPKEEEEALEEVKKLFTEQSHKDEVEKVYKALVQKVKDSIDDSIDRQEKIKNAVPEFVRHRMSQEHSNKFVMLKRVKQLQDDPNVLDQFSRFCDLQTLFPSDCISDVSKFIERVETVKEEGTYAFTEDCFSFAAGLSEERTTENGQSGKVLRILDTVIFIREWVREKFHNADYSKNGMNIDAVLNEEIREQIRNDFVELLEECTAIISNKSHVTFRDAYSLLCHYEKHKGVMSSLLSYCNQVKYTVNQKESNKLHVRSSEYENKNRRIVMDIAQGESSHVKSFYNLGDAEAPYECKRCLNELKAIYHLICLNQRMVQTVFETCRKSSMEVTVHHDTEGLFEWFFDLQIRIINEECVAQKLQAFREEHQKVRIALEKLAVGMKKDKGEKDNNKPPPAVNVGPFVVAFHFKDPARNLDESNIKDLTKTKRLEATKFIRTVKNISTVTIFGQQFRNDLDLYATLCPDIRANYGELYTKAGNLTKQPVSRFQSRAAEQLQKKILLFGCETQLMEKTMKKANFKKQLKLFLLINSKQARDILEKAHQKLEDQLTDLAHVDGPEAKEAKIEELKDKKRKEDYPSMIGCTLYQDFSAHVAQITYLERNEDYEEMFSCDEFWNEMIVKTNKEFHSSMQWFFEKRPKGDKRIETYMDYFERRDENWMLKAHMNSERLTLVAYSAVYNPVLDKYLMLERSCYCICRQCNVTKRYMANTGKKTDFCCMEVGENRGESSSTELISSFKGKFKGQDEKAQYSCITKNPRVEEIIMHHAKPNNQKIESLTVNNFLNLFKNICTDLNAEFFGTASSLNGSLVDRYLPSCVLNRIFKNIGDLENLKKGKGRAVAEKNDQNNSDAQNSAEDDKLEDDKSDQTNRIIPYRKMDDSQDKFRFDRIWQPADRNITGTVDKLIGIFEGKMDELEIWDVEFESRKITLEKLIAIAQKLESMQDDVKRKGLQQSTGEGQTKIEQHFTKQWEENSTTLSRVAENITELINETELKDDGASSKRISAAFQKLRHFRGENKFNFLGEQRYTSLFLELLRDVIEARQVNMLSSFSKSSEINVFVHKTHENKYGQHVWIPYSVEAKDEGVASSWEAIIKNPRKTLFLKQKDCFNFKLVEWDVAIDVVME